MHEGTAEWDFATKKKSSGKKSSSGPRAKALPAAAMAIATPDIARQIITFDSEEPSTFAAHTVPPAEVMLATAREAIPWPKGSEPKPAPLKKAPSQNDPLTQYDYLIVTWTTEEAKSLADTLTPGHPSKTSWYPYAHNFQKKFVPLITNKRAPALIDSHRLGSFFPTTISGKRVLCFKSELHMSQDGPKLPIANLWQQLIEEVKPKWVITTGTAGGIGAPLELGDVVVAPFVQFDCQKTFKSKPFHNSKYACSKVKTGSFSTAQGLFAANSSHLPKASRQPKIFTKPVSGVSNTDVVTTDFFAFDDSSNTYGLQGLGAAVEMGDAVLGMVIEEIGASAPNWVAVRNASDPQIDSKGLTIKEAGTKAAQIYERYGYWTTIPSAITCWAIVKDN